MVKVKTSFVCQQCGAASLKWLGRCPSCQSWDSLVEQVSQPEAAFGPKTAAPKVVPLSQAGVSPEPRIGTGVEELDRVLGGGLVQGMVVLVGGEPGIGKSTLMLKLASQLGEGGQDILYVSAEESLKQVGLRAERLGASQASVMLLAETGLESVMAAINEGGYAAVIIDSIQAMRASELGGAPGSVGQVRHCAAELAQLAKQSGCALFLVGHVTKEGSLAGPRLLEHLVDTVLYFESEPSLRLRLLRAVKNRFGATDEVGVFEMTERGLKPVLNPSAVFLAHRPENAPGSAVCAAMGGSRPLLVEVQALVSSSGLAMPRRQCLGVDSGRLHMLLAVLSVHAGLDMSGLDVFVNLAGGMKVVEPALDLAIAAAVASSLKQVPLPRQTICFGEVGLAGELRAVSRTQARLNESARQGFVRAVTASDKLAKRNDLEILSAQRLDHALNLLFK